MFLEIRDLSRSFGENKVVDSLSFSLEKGRLMCILGASGCGKTTTLNMLGGFLPPDTGSISLDGRDISNVPPERRPVTTVFQSYGLFPHMNVLKNVCYGLRYRGLSSRQIKARGMEYLHLVGLEDCAGAGIHQLSGGQQQRVALARALIVEPQLCLLDEPFSNLDAALRVRMRSELKKLQRELGISMIFVTHDQEEALILSDIMAVMDKGSFVQMDTPANIYSAPANSYVRDFLGMSDIRWSEGGEIVKVIHRT